MKDPQNTPVLIGTIKLEHTSSDDKHFVQCDWSNDRMRFKHQLWKDTLKTFNPKKNSKFKKWKKLPPNCWAVRNEGPAGKWENF